jgi:hypothetical protein
MTYRIRGIDPAPYRWLAGLSDSELAEQGAVRMTADSHPGYPCRVTLDDVEPGQTVLLINHVSHQEGPYRASHAIFVSEHATEPADYRERIPPALDRRVLSLRAFDRSAMMVDARLVQPGHADAAIRELLANEAVDHIDAHNAVRGCFAARVERD